jgi:hypothetical protein
VRIIAAALALFALVGCSAFRRELPPWARPMPASSSAAAATPSEDPHLTPPTGPVATVPELPAPTPPPPVVAAPPPAAPAPTRPAASPTSTAPPLLVAPAPAPPPAPPPAPQSLPLTASLPPAEARRLHDEAQRGIEDTERLLRQLDGRPLAPKDLETLRLAQGLVEQARKALGGQEYERAANLAAKARTLADDLSTHR